MRYTFVSLLELEHHKTTCFNPQSDMNFKYSFKVNRQYSFYFEDVKSISILRVTNGDKRYESI
jgi:hypothetical protein